MAYATVSTNEEWIPGHQYRLTFNVEPSTFLGLELPPLGRQRKVEQCIKSFSNRPEFELVSAVASERVLTIEVLAKDHASPIHLVVGGLIALAIFMYSVSLVLKHAEKFVRYVGDKLGPWAEPLGIGFLTVALAGFAVFVFVFARRQIS